MNGELGTAIVWILGIGAGAGVLGGAVAFIIHRMSSQNVTPDPPQIPKAPETDRQNTLISTMMTDDPTIALLPPYLILLAGADEAPGVRKVLLAQGDSHRFEIERETDPPGQERLLPNRIRIRSVYVARTGQGYIQYDPARNRCFIHNMADRRDQRNPIIVGNQMLQPQEALLLDDGAEIRIGKVRMVYHTHEQSAELTGDWSRVREVS